MELGWWPPPPELRLPSRLRVRWPTSLDLLLDPPIAEACCAFKDGEKRCETADKDLIQIEFPGAVIEKLHYNLASNGPAFLCDFLRIHSLEKIPLTAAKARCRNQRRATIKPTETRCHTDRVKQNISGRRCSSCRSSISPHSHQEHEHRQELCHTCKHEHVRDKTIPEMCPSIPRRHSLPVASTQMNQLHLVCLFKPKLIQSPSF